MKRHLYFPALLLFASIPCLRAQEPTPAAADATEPVIESVHLKGATMQEAAQLLTMGSGKQVAVSKGAAEETVTMYLEGLSLENTLKTICMSRGLWFKRDQATGVYHVMSLAEFRKGMNTYDEQTVEVVTILYPSAIEVGDSLKDLFGARVVWQRPEEGRGDPTRRIERALERMDTVASRAQFVETQTIASSVRRTDWKRFGREKALLENRGRRPQPRERSRAYTDGRVDEEMPEPEVRPEAAMARAAGEDVTLSELTGRPGTVHITAFADANVLLLRSADPGSIALVKQTIQDLDRPKPQVLLEVKVLEINVTHEHRRGIDWVFGRSSARTSGASQAEGAEVLRPDTTVLPYTDPRYPDATSYEQAMRLGDDGERSLLPQGAGADPRAFVFQYFTDSVRARLELLQEDGQITRLATPNLLVADNEASRVFIGSESSIIEEVDVDVETTTSESVSTTATEYEAQTSRQRIGTTLLLTPKIHADRTVTIRILQERSDRGQRREELFNERDRFISYDVDKSSVTTTVVAKDGHTVAIGGLVREQVNDEVRAVPGLHRIPIVGELFKHTTQVRGRRELLVLIRPVVLLAPGEAEEASSDFLERVSHHPSASPDLPGLGVTRPEDIPVGDHKARRRKRLEALKKRARTWEAP